MSEKVHQVIYRPDSTARKDWPDYRHCSGFYLVTQADQTLFAYISTYYRSAREVVADLIDRRDRKASGLVSTESGSMDFVVWYDSRIMAVVHEVFTSETGRCKSVFFGEKGNDPVHEGTLYGWPSRDEWIAAGRPDLIVLTPEDMERNRARENAGKDIRSIPLEDIRNPFEDEEEDEDD
jgi:hypothetical protein